MAEAPKTTQADRMLRRLTAVAKDLKLEATDAEAFVRQGMKKAGFKAKLSWFDGDDQKKPGGGLAGLLGGGKTDDDDDDDDF